MAAKNKVIAGDFKGQYVTSLLGSVSAGYHPLTKDYVADYQVIDEKQQKSAASAVGRGALGAFLLGPIGALAAISAKEKGTYCIAVEYTDGKKSLLEVDDKIHKAIMKSLF